MITCVVCPDLALAFHGCCMFTQVLVSAQASLSSMVTRHTTLSEALRMSSVVSVRLCIAASDCLASLQITMQRGQHHKPPPWPSSLVLSAAACTDARKSATEKPCSRDGSAWFSFGCAPRHTHAIVAASVQLPYWH